MNKTEQWRDQDGEMTTNKQKNQYDEYSSICIEKKQTSSIGNIFEKNDNYSTVFFFDV